MKQALIEMLICPSCLPDENELTSEIIEEELEDIITGSLTCARCGKVFPIRNGVVFLDPTSLQERPKGNLKYEDAPAVSSYLWSQYFPALNESDGPDAYSQWADLMRPHSGFSIDLGGAVGRFVFEMSQKSDFVIGVDNSSAFIQAARKLMLNRQIEIAVVEEGHITSQETIRLPQNWDSGKVEFIVADAEALPFRSNTFSSLSSLNLIDKVPHPITHLREMNRIAKEQDAQFLLSDPFSWSTDIAKESDWLGGTNSGSFSGRGIDNVTSILKGQKDRCQPAWKVEAQDFVWWKLRNHSNHFELIRSCYIKAAR